MNGNMTEKNLDSRCKAKTKKGKPCRAAATDGGLCFFHANPNKAVELGRIGGQSKGRGLPNGADPLPTLDSMKAVRDTVDRLIVDVYCGKLHPKIAAGLTPLLQLQLRALDATDAEQRIAKLERLAARREKSSKTNQSQSRTQFIAGLAPVSAPAPAPEKQSEHPFAKVEEALPAANRVVGAINNGATRISENESKLRLTKVEEPLQTQSREGGPTNHSAAHESGKESEPRATKIIEERLLAESREAGPRANDSERDSEPQLTKVKEPLPVGSEEDRSTNNVLGHGLEKESEQRVTKKEEPVPSESRAAGPSDPAAVREFLQQVLREAEELFPPEKRGWLGLK